MDGETNPMTEDQLRTANSNLEDGAWKSTVASETQTRKGVVRTSLRSRRTPASTRKALVVLGTVFVTSVLTLLVIYTKFPKLEKDEYQYFKLPRDIDDAKNLGKVLSRYKDKFFYEVLGGVLIAYIFLQTFAIPGSIFLSILSGFLFPFPAALLLVCFCSAVGASFCYMLSYLVGRPVIIKYFPEKAEKWAITVNRHRHSLLNYIIFLRITPFLPNWFINLTSPIIDVPLIPFFLGTFLGVAPPSFVAIQTGTTLHKLTSSNDAFTWNSVLLLVGFAILSLIPVLFKRKLQDKSD